MFRKFGLLVAISLAAANASGQEWARQMFDSFEHDFGTVARAAKAEYLFVFTNKYLEDVHIAGVRASCGCTSVRVENATVKTYEKGAIVASINSGTFLGRRGATLTVTIDKPYPAEVQLRVAAFIRSDVMVNPSAVQFGTVDMGLPAEQKVQINYMGSSNWEITGIRSSNPHVSGQLTETSRNGGQVWYELKVNLDKNVPAGFLKEHIMLTTNDGQNAEIPVAVEGRVISAITVSPASLFMGVIQPGQQVTKQLVVQGKKPFKIVSITCDDESFKFTKDDKVSPVHLIPVTFIAGKDLGKVVKAIRIETDLGNEKPELSAYAVVSQQ